MNEEEECELCGAPMPKGEEMFRYHGHSGPCPRPPMGPRTTIRDNTLKCGICSHSEQEFIDLKHALAANEAVIQEQLKEHCRDRKELLSEIEQLQARVKELEGKQ